MASWNLKQFFVALRVGAVAAIVVITFFTALGLFSLHNLLSDLHTAERSKPAWIASRVEFDLLRFQKALAEFEAGNIQSEEIETRFDLLWSRVIVATTAGPGSVLRAMEVNTGPLDQLLETLQAQEEAVFAIERPDDERLQTVKDAFAALEAPQRTLTLESLEKTSLQSKSTRENLLHLTQKTALFIAFMAIALILTLLLVWLELRRQKRARKETYKLLLASRAATQEKSRFISIVNHELRTPLTSIMGSLGLVKGGAAGELPSKTAKLIDVAFANSEKLSKLINDLLEIDKAEEGRLAMNIASHDLAGIVRESMEANAHYGLKRNVQLVEADFHSDVYANFDPQRMGQVMANFLSNAIKFSEPDSSVEVSVFERDGRAHVSVRDFGIGIAEENLDAIFERFHQIDDSNKRQAGGTGLGLSIAKAIVEGHDGTLTVTSESGKGSVFSISLPTANHQVRKVA